MIVWIYKEMINMISNSNMAAFPIWRQFQFGGNSNMAPKQYGSQHGMPIHSTKYNYHMTDSYIKISATPNKTNRHTHKIKVLRNSWLSNPPNHETKYSCFIDISLIIRSYCQCSQNQFAEYINKTPVTPLARCFYIIDEIHQVNTNN